LRTRPTAGCLAANLDATAHGAPLYGRVANGITAANSPEAGPAEVAILPQRQPPAHTTHARASMLQDHFLLMYASPHQVVVPTARVTLQYRHTATYATFTRRGNTHTVAIAIFKAQAAELARYVAPLRTASTEPMVTATAVEDASAVFPAVARTTVQHAMGCMRAATAHRTRADPAPALKYALVIHASQPRLPSHHVKPHARPAATANPASTATPTATPPAAT
jgi:hypothetical protein